MSYYRRYLPHWQPNNATYFVTIRLADSLPRAAIARLKLERRNFMKQLKDHLIDSKTHSTVISPKKRRLALRSRINLKIFKAYEDILDNNDAGPHWLTIPAVAEIIKEAIEYRNHKEYALRAYSIMPNHVHMIVKLLIHNLNGKEHKGYPLTNVLQGLKSYTGLIANQALNRKGSFWQSESYDHVIWDIDELERLILYTIHNPVKAGLVKNWMDWPYSYCDPVFMPDF